MSELQNAPAVPSPVWWNRLVRSGNLYTVACLCLLLVAPVLRFYELSERTLWYDEAVAANNSNGTLRQAVFYTRHRNTSPILYPLILWVIQKVESSPFSVRMVPAAAGVLMIATLLFLLPRVGVSRRAAFLAALLATGSSGAVGEARGVREYSVDALVAALMIIGLLAHLRIGGGQKRAIILCVSLFVAPLVQYGLVLFSLAVIATGGVERFVLFQREAGSRTRRPRSSGQRRRPAAGLMWICKDLCLPGVCFAVGSAISWMITLRFQLDERERVMGYLSRYYYEGAWNDIRAILDFALSRTWDLLTWSLSEIGSIVALTTLGAVLLIVVFKRLRVGTLPLLFACSLAIAVSAAVLRVYPLGGFRFSTYLLPVIFVTCGQTLHSVASNLPLLVGRAWLALAVGLIVLAQANTLIGSSLYQPRRENKAVLRILEERVTGDDIVYIPAGSVPTILFYQKERRGNYYYGSRCTWGGTEACVQELLKLPQDKRVWLVFLYEAGIMQKELERLEERGDVERIVADLWLTSNIHSVAEVSLEGSPE